MTQMYVHPLVIWIKCWRIYTAEREKVHGSECVKQIKKDFSDIGIKNYAWQRILFS